MGRQRRWAAATAVALGLLATGAARAASPPQRLPSAVLVYPLIVADGSTDTKVEIVNLSRREVNLGCIYVPSPSCGGFDFHVRLTPNQPLSWRASRGVFTTSTFTAVPPFSGIGELKCVVETELEDRDAHNTIQGRAAVFSSDGQTIGYSAVGFLRLIDGPLTDVIDLDGVTYTQCPDEQHFAIIASDANDPAAQSELVLTPCTENFGSLNPTSTVVQFLVYNEFEEVLSASTTVTCYRRESLADLSHAFLRDVLGSDTGHLIVKGVQSPVLALVIDRFRTTANAPVTAGNEPALRGGRSAEITFP